MNLVGGGLIGKALRKVPGKEFSHWVPKRFTNQFTKAGNASKHYKPMVDKYFGWFTKSRFNGNYVSRKFHAKTDLFRMQFMTKAFKETNDMLPKWLQRTSRVPGWIPGGALVGGAAVTDFCECP